MKKTFTEKLNYLKKPIRSPPLTKTLVNKSHSGVITSGGKTLPSIVYLSFISEASFSSAKLQLNIQNNANKYCIIPENEAIFNNKKDLVLLPLHYPLLLKKILP